MDEKCSSPPCSHVAPVAGTASPLRVRNDVKLRVRNDLKLHVPTRYINMQFGHVRDDCKLESQKYRGNQRSQQMK
jgi:hypothetical protein